MLLIGATLGAMTLQKVDNLNPVLSEVGRYQNLRYTYRFILDLDKTAEDADLISEELNFSNWLISAAQEADRPDLKNDPFVAKLSELRQSEGYLFKDRDESKRRLATLYTPAKMVELALLLEQFEGDYRGRVFDYYMELYRLVRYLLISLSCLAMSLGLSIISFEILRRRSTRNNGSHSIS